MKATDIKPGSILLWKDYKWYKKLWYQLLEKELKYNKFIVFNEPTTYLLGKRKPSEIILEPKRTYSNKEAYKFLILTNKVVYDKNDLFTIINNIRPNTIHEGNSREIDDLINNKYYRVRYIEDDREQYTYSWKTSLQV